MYLFPQAQYYDENELAWIEKKKKKKNFAAFVRVAHLFLYIDFPFVFWWWSRVWLLYIVQTQNIFSSHPSSSRSFVIHGTPSDVKQKQKLLALFFTTDIIHFRGDVLLVCLLDHYYITCAASTLRKGLSIRQLCLMMESRDP